MSMASLLLNAMTRAVLMLVWPSILLQYARDRVATAAETVTASQIWSNMVTCLRTHRLTHSLAHTQLKHQRLVSDKSAIPVK